MSYDAGSIESRLDLDRTPFQEGLARARQEADELSHKRIAPVVDLDTARAERKAKDTRDELDRLGEKTARPKIDIDTAKPLAQLALIKAQIDELNRKSANVGGGAGGSRSTGSGFGSGSGAGAGGALLTAGLALSPALIPITAALTAGVGALAGAFTAAGVGAGGFALLAKPQLEAVTTAQKQLTAAQAAYDKATTNSGRAAALRQEYLIYAQLTPQQRTYMDQLTGLKSVYKDLQASVSTQVFSVAASGIHALSTAGELFKPVFQAAGDTFKELATQFDQWVSHSAGLRQFVDFLTRQTGPAIYSFAHDLANVARGFGGILMAFEPLLGPVEAGLTSFTAKFAAWGAGLGSSAGFQHFLDYVRQNAPLVGHMFEDLAKAVGTIITQLAPFGPIGLKVITMLAELINQHPGLVKLAAALLLVGRATSGLAGAAGSLTGIVKKFQDFGGLFSGGGGLDGAEPKIGGISAAVRTLGGGSLVTGGIMAGALAGGALIAVNAFAHFATGMHEANTAISQINTSLAKTPLSTAAYSSAIDGIDAKITSLHSKLSGFGGFAGWFTGSSESAAAQLDKYRMELDKISASADKAATRNKILAEQLSPGKGITGGLVPDAAAMAKNLAIINQMTAAGVTFNGTFDQSKAQVQAFAAAAKDGAPAQMALANWFVVSGNRASTAAQKTQAYQAAIDALSGSTMDLLQSGDAAQKALNDIGQAVASNTRDLSGNTDAAIQNRGAIASAVQPILQHVAAMNKNGASTQQVTLYTLGMASSLSKSLVQLGFNKGAVDKLLQSLIQIPPSKATNVTVPGAAAADGTIRNLNKDLNNIPDHRTISLNVISNAASALGAIQSMINNINPNIPLTVSGYANLSKLTSQQFQANGSILSAFAGGGFEDHVAQIARAGAMRLWAEPETGGEAYIPLAASKRTRSTAIWQETGRRLGMGSGKTVNQTFQYAGPLTPQVVSEARRQIDFAMGS